MDKKISFSDLSRDLKFLVVMMWIYTFFFVIGIIAGFVSEWIAI